MKRTLLILLALTGLSWGDSLIYQSLPSPDCSLSVVGKATIITDGSGSPLCSPDYGL